MKPPTDTQADAPRLMYLTTSAVTVRFLHGQLTFMRRRGFDVYVVSSPGADLDTVGRQEEVVTLAIPMQREIRPAKDCVSLYRLLCLFRTVRPDVVVAGTPKAGLLGMLAAWLTRVPVRIYLLHGLRLETTRGLKRTILALAERVTSACATRIFCVSESLRKVYVQMGLALHEKTFVAHKGSANGIDADHFRPSGQPPGVAMVRSLMDIPADAPVVGFVGRLTRDKGLVELLEAFKCLLAKIPQAWLLLVGDFEKGDPVPGSCVDELMAHSQVAIASFVDDPLPHYQAMDVLAYASHREGLGVVPLEAAAVNLPTAAFGATGTVDAVMDGVTGTLVSVGDHVALARAIERYIKDPSLRTRHGKAGRERIIHDFRPDQIWQALFEEYTLLMRKAGLSQPRAEAETSEQRALSQVLS